MNPTLEGLTSLKALFPDVAPVVICDFYWSFPEETRITKTLEILLDYHKDPDRLATENESYAKHIHTLFPIYSEHKIMKKLTKYGNFKDRSKLIIRNILKNTTKTSTPKLGLKRKSFHEDIAGECSSSSEKLENGGDMDMYFECDDDLNAPIRIPNDLCTQLEDVIKNNNEFLSQASVTTTSAVSNTEHLERPMCNGEAEIPVDAVINSQNAETVIRAEDMTDYLNVNQGPENSLPTIFQTLRDVAGVSNSAADQQSASSNTEIPVFYSETELPLNVVINPENVGKIVKQEERTDYFNVNQELQNTHTLPTINQTLRDVFNDSNYTADQQSTSNSLHKSLGFEVDESWPKSKRLKTHQIPGPSTSRSSSSRHNFDLIEYLACRTRTSQRFVADYCLRNGIDAYQKPHYSKMAKYIDEIIEISEPLHEEAEDPTSSDDGFLGRHPEKTSSPSKRKHKDPISRRKHGAIVIVDGVEETQVEKEVLNIRIISRVQEVFPDVEPNHIRNLYDEMPTMATSEAGLIDLLIEKLLEDPDYPKKPKKAPSPERVINPDEQYAFVKELLPDADPTYLRMKVTELNPEELRNFVSEALESKNYPTMKEYLRKQQLSSQMRQYTTEFSVEKFVKLVPDPVATFSDPSRHIILNREDDYYLSTFFKNKFNRTAARVISSKLYSNHNQAYKTYKELLPMSMELKNKIKTKRIASDLSSIVCQNIPLLQELAFIENEKAVLDYIEQVKFKKEEERKHARESGLMSVCICCYDDEIMPVECFKCNNGCVCCKQCIIRSTEVAFGEGKLNFPCLGDCKLNFDLSTLQNFLPPNLFSKIAQKKAVEEVKAAGIEDLEFCPFCDFATIPSGPPETNKIFACQNPDCLKESCRLCKESSHVPLRCDEVEKDEEVKKRVFIENKMTEALLRKCWKCGVSFFKEEGCNKMTCSCGALMCYVCGKPVTDYKHFNGIGGDKHQLCPLYSDTLKMNQQNVVRGAQQAKAEIGVTNLKIDPTTDIDKFYKERAKKLPREPYLEQLQGQLQRNALVMNAEIDVQQLRNRDRENWARIARINEQIDRLARRQGVRRQDQQPRRPH